MEDLLKQLGNSVNVQDVAVSDVEEFFCKLYDENTQITSINMQRASMFRSSQNYCRPRSKYY